MSSVAFLKCSILSLSTDKGAFYSPKSSLTRAFLSTLRIYSNFLYSSISCRGPLMFSSIIYPRSCLALTIHSNSSVIGKFGFFFSLSLFRKGIRSSSKLKILLVDYMIIVIADCRNSVHFSNLGWNYIVLPSAPSASESPGFLTFFFFLSSFLLSFILKLRCITMKGVF